MYDKMNEMDFNPIIVLFLTLNLLDYGAGLNVFQSYYSLIFNLLKIIKYFVF